MPDKKKYLLSVSYTCHAGTGAGDILVTSLLDLSLYSFFSKYGSFGRKSSFVDELTNGTHIMMWDKRHQRKHSGDSGIPSWHRWWHGCMGRCSPTPSMFRGGQKPGKLIPLAGRALLRGGPREALGRGWKAGGRQQWGVGTSAWATGLCKPLPSVTQGSGSQPSHVCPQPCLTIL